MNFKDMDLQQLRTLHSDLESRVLAIKRQIADARAIDKQVGAERNPDWYRRAHAAASIAAQNLNKAARALGERSREDRRNWNGRLAESFIRAAKRRLTKELWDSLWEDARAEAGVEVRT